MTAPNWNIGVVARGRFVEMAKDSWDEQKIWYMGKADPPCWTVEIWSQADHTFCCGCGNTIGLAVAEAYEEWQGKESES